MSSSNQPTSVPQSDVLVKLEGSDMPDQLDGTCEIALLRQQKSGADVVFATFRCMIAGAWVLCGPVAFFEKVDIAFLLAKTGGRVWLKITPATVAEHRPVGHIIRHFPSVEQDSSNSDGT